MKATAFLTATLAASGVLANIVVDDTPVTANLTVPPVVDGDFDDGL